MRMEQHICLYKKISGKYLTGAVFVLLLVLCLTACGGDLRPSVRP